MNPLDAGFEVKKIYTSNFDFIEHDNYDGSDTYTNLNGEFVVAYYAQCPEGGSLYLQYT
jgi:hypothetical protein